MVCHIGADGSARSHTLPAMIRSFLLVAVLAQPLMGQTGPERDSILARLERAEEQIALLRQQLAAQSTSQVQARSHASVEISGRVLANGFANSARVNNLDVPQFVLPALGAAAPSTSPKTLGAVLRQTTLAIDVRGLKALDGDVSAHASADFFGGTQAGTGGRRLFPEPRLRIARAAIRWGGTELMAGQDVPLITPVEPVSLASTGTPNFALAGNLWFWLPQVRATLETPPASGGLRFAVQGAVLAPWSGGDVLPNDPDAVDVAERSQRPFLEGRVRARWGDDDQPGEIGVGGHIGWLSTGTNALAQGTAVAVTVRVPLTSLFELRGEAYQGRLLRGLGGGGVGQNFGSTAAPINDRGAWAQLNLTPSTTVLLGGGCGVDNPTDADGPLRRRNSACEGHLNLRPGGSIVLGVEARRLSTLYASGAVKSTHLNVAAGVEF